MFKSGAVNVTKISKEGAVDIPEQQSVTVAEVETSKANAEDSQPPGKRERQLPYWLGSTHQSIDVLIDIYTRILPNLWADKELHAGIVILRGIAKRMFDRLGPSVEKYGEKTSYGKQISESLRDALFPAHNDKLGSYEVLVTLQALKMYYSHIEGHLLALLPTAKGLWDKEFVEAVVFCQEQLGRLEAWANEHLKVKSVQTLLVPDTKFRRKDSLMGDEERFAG